MQRFRFTLEVTVTDAARCYEAAREKIIEDGREWDGVTSDDEIIEQLGTAEDHPNIPACVEALFEPPTDSPPGTRHQWIPEDSEGRSPPRSFHGIGPDAA